MPFLNDTSALPNQSTPLAFFTPDAAYQAAVANYCTAGALAVLIWDILDNTKADYRLMFRGKLHFSIPILAYIISRYAEFISKRIILPTALLTQIIVAAPTGNCIKFNTVVHAWCPVSICCSGLLFFLRLRAIYHRNRIVVAAFFVLWIGLIASSLFIPLGMSGGAIGSTLYCQYTSIAQSAYVGVVGPLVYDTLVFGAISWRLIHVGSVDMSCRETFHALFSRRGLPEFTDGILVDGQLYYLITMISGIVAVALLYAPSIPAPLRSMGTNPYLAIVNIMACRVFRSTMSGLIRGSQIPNGAVVMGPPHQMVFSVGLDEQASRDTELADVVPAHRINATKTSVR
ncbi:hypothetical protein HYPSUDRAFT_1104897 [Hypholoma sublateritium FD-334 SS-4]|uniref:Glucose receptor Git3 N-terminal domain-containing protein n=1 Tax=Hypholoma sublateritium (strain FD-334 SS-4) TaxID=945553 RepID=A0A0D2KR35_HYPSF|nr:hypothetical protein HYPSUDRAFT_1104897 [Hypholoma sublateritium FD-334 SS-4]